MEHQQHAYEDRVRLVNGRLSKTVKRHYSGSNKNTVGTISGEMRDLSTRVMAAEVTAELTTSPLGMEDLERNAVARQSLNPLTPN